MGRKWAPHSRKPLLDISPRLAHRQADPAVPGRGCRADHHGLGLLAKSGGCRRRVGAQLEIEFMGRTHGQIARDSRGSRQSWPVELQPRRCDLGDGRLRRGYLPDRPRDRCDSPRFVREHVELCPRYRCRLLTRQHPARDQRVCQREGEVVLSRSRSGRPRPDGDWPHFRAGPKKWGNWSLPPTVDRC